jgi:hypothetical protein
MIGILKQLEKQEVVGMLNQSGLRDRDALASQKMPLQKGESMKPKRLFFYGLLVVGGLTLASKCLADDQPAPAPAQAPAEAPAPAPARSLFQINIGQPSPPPPAPVIVAPAPAPVVVVPESYVLDGYEYVGFVGGQYVYLGPGNVWMPLEPYRLHRWYYYQRYHPDWRAHMIHQEIHNEHLQHHLEHVQEKDAARLQEQKQKDAARLQRQQAKQEKKKHGGD